MKTKFKIQVVAILAGLFAVQSMAQAGNAEAGKNKAAVCGACHGADGNSANPAWPKLAGQHEKYLVKQLQAFKAGASGGRKAAASAQMYGMAAALSDQDMADLGAFYAAQKIKTGVADDKLAAKGKAIYQGGITDTKIAACSGCHGPAGKGNAAAGFPALAGQHAAYTVAQLKAFHSGKRVNDPAEMMRGLVGKMTDADMKAVAEYIQGLY